MFLVGFVNSPWYLVLDLKKNLLKNLILKPHLIKNILLPLLPDSVIISEWFLYFLVTTEPK